MAHTNLQSVDVRPRPGMVGCRIVEVNRCQLQVVRGGWQQPTEESRVGADFELWRCRASAVGAEGTTGEADTHKADRIDLRCDGRQGVDVGLRAARGRALTEHVGAVRILRLQALPSIAAAEALVLGWERPGPVWRQGNAVGRWRWSWTCCGPDRVNRRYTWLRRRSRRLRRSSRGGGNGSSRRQARWRRRREGLCQDRHRVRGLTGCWGERGSWRPSAGSGFRWTQCRGRCQSGGKGWYSGHRCCRNWRVSICRGRGIGSRGARLC